MAVSYEPLWHVLINKKMKKSDLYSLGFARSTVTKMGRNEYVALPVLEKLCLTLECRIEDVVEILPDVEQ